ncbi:MAG TPA: class I SAM-dependent methyltransferase [bacterium]
MKLEDIPADRQAKFRFSRKPLHALNDIQRSALDQIKHKIQDQYAYEEIECFCGQTQDILVGRYDRYGLPHWSRLCGNCGLIRTSPRLSEASYHDFYEQHFVQLHYGIPAVDEAFALSRVTIMNHPANGMELLNTLRPLVDLRESRRVLEIGCGAGWTLVPLKDAGLAVAGCDYDSRQVALGRKLFGLDLIAGGVEQVSASGQKFDLIITINLLEHILDLRGLLRQAHDLLDDNGLFYVMTPGLFHFVSQMYPSLQYQLMIYHTYLFNEWNLEYVLGACGFQRVRCDRFITSVWRKTADGRNLAHVDFHVPVVDAFLKQYGDTKRQSGLGALKSWTRERGLWSRRSDSNR